MPDDCLQKASWKKMIILNYRKLMEEQDNKKKKGK